MAVQQGKPTRSKRDTRHFYDVLAIITNLSTDKTSGEKHLCRRITVGGYHRGREVIAK